MPRLPKRACSHPGCPQLTEGRFCEEHQKQENRRYEKYDRDLATRKRYGNAWRKIRESYVAQHPLCEMCQKEGRLTAVEEVHHILPLARGGTHDHSNLMQPRLPSLAFDNSPCPCANRVTRKPQQTMVTDGGNKTKAVYCPLGE